MRGVSWLVLVLVLVGAVGAAPVSAAVLCVKKKGTVVRRDTACKSNEQALQLADFGAQGPQGDQGVKGDKGDQGDQGVPGPLVDTLPSGKTLRGSFFLNHQAAAGGAEAGSAVSFGFRLATEPTVHFIKDGDAPPAECPGTASVPEALPGHFCMFENSSTNATTQGICGTGGFGCSATGAGENRYGAYFFAFSNAAGLLQSTGTWAVTAP